MVVAIRAYQRVISPLLSVLGRPLGMGCRFTPSCSAYALEAVQKRGAGLGASLTVGRVCRCHPWGGSGYDPVPAREMEAPPIALGGRAIDVHSLAGREPVLGPVPRQNR